MSPSSIELHPAGRASWACLRPDTRREQAARVAAFLQATPEGATLRQIDAACDVGSVTKLLSVMRLEYGYRIVSRRCQEACNGGSRRRERKKFFLLPDPESAQLGLFTQ